MPEAASTLAPSIDSLFYFVTWTSAILFSGVVAAMVYFAFRYRRRQAAEVPVPIKESKLLELTWTVIPTILVLIVFTWGFKTYIKIGVAPPEAYEIRVTGKKWLWEFAYPNGTTSVGELHVPVDRPVKLTMNSVDVIHSFFVPAFRVKHDVIPNRYTQVWFQPTRTGEFDVFCTEYCGTSHSGMLAKVIVQTQEEFNEWVETGGTDLGDMPPVELGQMLYTKLACNSCHSLDGSPGVGPTWQGLFGKTGHPTSAGPVTVDENYLREAITQPAAKVVEGYQPVMPPYPNLSEAELAGLIAFIKEQQ